MQYKLVLAFMIELILGCSEKDHYILNTTSKIKHESFKETQKLKGILLPSISDSLFIPNSIHIGGNYLFISERTSDAIIHIVKVPNDEYVGIFGTRGSGPGEVLNSWKFFSPKTNILGVFDPELGKAILYDIDSLIDENLYKSEYFHRDMVYSNGVIIHENKLHFLGNNNSESRLYSIGTNTLKDSLKIYGEFPKLNKPYPNISLKEQEQILNYSRLSNKGNLLVMSYYNIPLVEIYDLDKNHRTSISGPDKLPPPDLFGDLRYYYASYVSDKYIYLLYIEDKTKFEFNSHTVLILDHYGSPVKKLTLDKDIFQLAVFEDKILYGLIHGNDQSEFTLIKYILE